MTSHGLITNYKVGRPLTAQEIADHIPQHKRTHSKPDDQLSVIKMNSTYLECVDKFFGDRGEITFVGLGALGILCSGLVLLFKIALKPGETYWLTWLAILYCLLGFFFAFYVVSRELFRHTHYPIRFNRKTRKVHAFRPNGTIITADWDKIYFTLWHPTHGNQVLHGSEVLGHVLAEDGNTVTDTFGMPFEFAYIGERIFTTIYSQFEFVRRYMEEPKELASLADSIQVVQDVADHRESWLAGTKRLLETSPIGIIFSFPRLLANYTCRIPRWPEDIEAQCPVDPDDPYIVNAERLREKRLDEIYADMPLDEQNVQNAAKKPRAE